MRDRLIELVAELGMGQNRFEMKVGWNPGTISRMKFGVRSDLLEGVIREFPTLNIKWLITGEGEMWEKPVQTAQTPQTNTISTEWLMARIEAQERLIEQLSKGASKDISQSVTL